MLKFFENVFEVLGWIRIVLSPVLISLFIAVPVYYNKPDALGITIAIMLVSIGLLIGIKWANRTWKKDGTQQFLSRISSSADLDPKPKKEENKIKS
jgi:hypothetical protein